MNAMLLISDRMDFQRRIAQALAQEEWEVTSVDGFTPALRCISELAPDFVLIDRLASGFDGFDMLLELKARFPDLPILVYLLKSTETVEMHRQRICHLLRAECSRVDRDPEPA